MGKDTNGTRRRTVLRTIGAVGISAGGVASLSGGVAAHPPGCDVLVDASDSHAEADTVQGGIDVANPGETVCVVADTYDEAVTVDVEDLTLSGPNAGTPGYRPRDPEATIEGQVVVSADGATIDGFDVSPPPARSNQEAEAIRVSNAPDGVRVENTVVRDFAEDGIPAWEGVDGINVFGGNGTDPIEGVEIRGNAVRRIDGRDAKGGAAGISVQGNVDGAVVERNVVTDVGMEATQWAFGIVVRGTGNHDLAPRDVTVVGNEATAVRSDPGSTTVGVGLGVEGNDGECDVHRNTVENTELGAEVKNGAAATTTLTENNITGNGLGVANRDTHALTATCNWWGNANGPEHRTTNGVEGDVAYDPWSRRPVGAGWNERRHCSGGP